MAVSHYGDDCPNSTDFKMWHIPGLKGNWKYNQWWYWSSAFLCPKYKWKGKRKEGLNFWKSKLSCNLIPAFATETDLPTCSWMCLYLAFQEYKYSFTWTAVAINLYIHSTLFFRRQIRPLTSLVDLKSNHLSFMEKLVRSE